MKKALLILCFTFLAQANSVCPPVSLSVSRINAINIEPNLAKSLREHIESSLLSFPGIVVYTESMLNRSVSRRFTSSGDRKILSGTVSLVGDTYNIVMKVTDQSRGTLECSVSRKHQGQVDGLFAVVDTALYLMFDSYTSADCDTLTAADESAEPDSTQIKEKEVGKETGGGVEPGSADQEQSSFLAEQIGLGALAIFASFTLIFLYSK
ncbi:MAG: hypothetical protein ACLFQB_05740 [Chitinispirillaceae bacterium]